MTLQVPQKNIICIIFLGCNEEKRKINISVEILGSGHFM